MCIRDRCRFRYFCRYGLGAKERRPAELDALEYGSLMHYLFEQVIGSREQDITAMPEDTLKALVQTLSLIHICPRKTEVCILPVKC